MEILSSVMSYSRCADFAKRIVSEFVSFPCPACAKNMPEGGEAELDQKGTDEKKSNA